jgi:hypothetical protein
MPARKQAMSDAALEVVNMCPLRFGKRSEEAIYGLQNTFVRSVVKMLEESKSLRKDRGSPPGREDERKWWLPPTPNASAVREHLPTLVPSLRQRANSVVNLHVLPQVRQDR